MDHQIWTVEKGYSPPTIVIKRCQIPKLGENWDENEMKNDSLNCKAMNGFFLGLSSEKTVHPQVESTVRSWLNPIRQARARHN